MLPGAMAIRPWLTERVEKLVAGLEMIPDEALDAFVRSCERPKASTPDRVGIVARVGDLPSWPAYVPLRDWHDGGSRWRCFWRHTVCRLLTPRRYRDKLAEYRRLELAVKQEFLNEVLRLWEG